MAAGPELKKFDFTMLDKRQNIMVLITPEQALALLEDHNTHNRKIRETSVRRWAKEMTLGRWDPDASDIKIDAAGNLIDGQHRLMACVRSGVPFGTLLRTGLRGETQRRVDVGNRRSTADTFRLEGVGYANNVAASILLRRRYEEGEANGKRISSDLRLDLSADDSLDYLRAHPAHEKLAVSADNCYRIGPGVTRTVYTTALPMFAEADETDAQRFIDAFLGGEWGGPGAPMQAMVRYVSQARTPSKRAEYRARNVNERHLLAFIKVWNAWRMNESLERLTVRDDEALVPVV